MAHTQKHSKDTSRELETTPSRPSEASRLKELADDYFDHPTAEKWAQLPLLRAEAEKNRLTAWKDWRDRVLLLMSAVFVLSFGVVKVSTPLKHAIYVESAWSLFFAGLVSGCVVLVIDYFRADKEVAVTDALLARATASADELAPLRRKVNEHVEWHSAWSLISWTFMSLILLCFILGLLCLVVFGMATFG